MWADTIHLSIGHWQLGVRVDSARTAARLRTLFAPYLSLEGTDLPSNFSIRAPHRRIRRTPGSLYLGGSQIARSSSFDELAGALAIRLSSLQHIDPPLMGLDMRPFVCGDIAVLVDVPRPMLVEDELLRKAGIDELMTWQAAIDLSDRTLVDRPLLPDLDWQGGRLRPPAYHPRRRQISAVVARGRNDRADIAEAWARASSNRNRWLDALREMEAHDRLIAWNTVADAPTTVLAAFGDPTA